LPKYTVRPSAKWPMTFRGRQLASLDTRTPDNPKWIEATLYETDYGRLVLEIHERTRIEHAIDHTSVMVADTPEGLIAQFGKSDPVPGFVWDILKQAGFQQEVLA